ncbi:FAD binding domain-containing protein [Candidatus Bipolaricaulota bacterium]|nr:FAD binding domain-containing protein [Candidatus Bipolaricaulota bacterium]
MRLRGVLRFHWARDVDEALSLLRAYEGKGAILAGGVDLARSARTDIEGLIDITGTGLSYVREDPKGLRIGATTTLSELLFHPLSREYAGGVIAETLRLVAYPALRNVATIGGATVSAHPWADIPTMLVALGAEARWRNEEKEEKASVEELYKTQFRGIFREAILLELVLPHWDGVFVFEKIGRNAGDIALLNVCAGLGLREGKIAWARVAVGARPERGERLPWLEEMLLGKEPDENLWKKAEEEVKERIKVGSDRRASGEWRREVAGVLVRRTLARAAGKAVK